MSHEELENETEVELTENESEDSLDGSGDDSQEFVAVISGAGGISAKAEFNTELEDGTSQREFEVKIKGGEAGKIYAIRVDDVEVGSLTVDAHGFGKLELSDELESGDDDDDHGILPASFPKIAAGTKIEIGDQLSGQFDVHDGFENEAQAEKDEFVSFMTGKGGIAAKAEFETKENDGVVQRAFEVKVLHGEADKTYAISVDGVAVGSLTVNKDGFGALELDDELDSQDDSNGNGNEHGVLPASFPTITAGSVIEIGDELKGQFSLDDHNETADESIQNEDDFRAVFRRGTKAMGLIEFENHMIRGEHREDLALTVKGLEADHQYSVRIDGHNLAKLTADVNGSGSLIYSDDPGVGEHKMPHWLGKLDLTDGTLVRVGKELKSRLESLDLEKLRGKQLGDRLELVSRSKEQEFSAKANFHWTVKEREVESELKIRVRGGEANQRLNVRIEGEKVGVIELNKLGNGYEKIDLALTHATEKSMPSLSMGSKIQIGREILGEFKLEKSSFVSDPFLQMKKNGTLLGPQIAST